MTNEEKEVAIGKACNWPPYRYFCGWRFLPKQLSESVGSEGVYAYTENLNAMHAAFLCLTPRQQQQFISHLRNICAAQGNWPECATAEQRADAFLLTINVL